MLADRIEAKWIDAFCEVFERCAVKAGDVAAILSETQSRALNVHLAELALLRMGARPFHVVVPTPRNRQIVPIRSTGASEAIQRLGPVVTALQQAGFVVDCTVEGLMHAPETPDILKAGARILVISNEHPEALERMVPDTTLEKRVRAAARMLRGTKRMRVTSKAGTDLGFVTGEGNCNDPDHASCDTDAAAARLLAMESSHIPSLVKVCDGMCSAWEVSGAIFE